MCVCVGQGVRKRERQRGVRDKSGSQKRKEKRIGECIFNILFLYLLDTYILRPFPPFVCASHVLFCVPGTKALVSHVKEWRFSHL